jgi:hypothetical protein
VYVEDQEDTQKYNTISDDDQKYSYDGMCEGFGRLITVYKYPLTYTYVFDKQRIVFYSQ